jgi:hypothetical protein
VIAFFRRFCQIYLFLAVRRELDHPVFTSLDFETVIFLQTKVVGLAYNPQPGGPGVCIYVHSDEVAQLYLQAQGSFSLAFCNLQGYSGHIVTRLHTGWAHVYYVEIT